MSQSKFVAYYRVSTARQGASGLGLEAQREAVATYLKLKGGKLVAEFEEVESGKLRNRPKLEAALRRCRLTGATLLVAKLDRLARNVLFIATMKDSGMNFVAADMPDAGEFTVNVLAAVAEHEAAMISARTKAALAAAKARGTKLGGYRGKNIAEYAARGAAASVQVRTAKAAKARAEVLKEIRDIQSSGATSLRQIAAVLNASSVQTPRKGQWTAMQVKRVLDAA